MKVFEILFISVLGLAAGNPAGQFLSEEECNEPLWTVVGRHYVPRTNCKARINYEKDMKIYRKYERLLLGSKSIDEDRTKALEILEKIKEFLPSLSENKDMSLSNIQCTLCSSIIGTYRELFSTENSKEKLVDLATKYCIDFNIMTKPVCEGIVDTYADTIMTIIDTTNSTDDTICSVFLNAKCGNQDLPEFQWKVKIPPTMKPPIVKPTPPPESVRHLKVLHISDTHWDPQYEVGSWAECKLPLCCRKENVPPNEQASKAGRFGGWKCDTPEETFDNVLEHIAKQHPDIDYIIWTGDIPAHDIWEQTRSENLDILKRTVAKLAKTFPKILMYPALGNHESIPPNLYPTPKNEKNPMDWLFEEVNNQWSQWLPENVSKTVRMGAFYTTLIRPGLRLVSMNMNYCYTSNWWLVNDSIDPVHELQWFVDLLQEAENNNEKVHVIGHIPPGSSECLRTWQNNYYNIINRYEGTVTAQFFGHTHSDEFELFYDMKDTKRPLGVAYVGPSITTYTYHNPSYRIYYVEGDHDKSKRYVLDHESWYMDLEKANELNEAEWKKLYSAKDAYEMPSLYPEDWHNFYLKLKTSNETLNLYHTFYWNDSPKRPICNEKCRKNRLCGIRSCEQYAPL